MVFILFFIVKNLSVFLKGILLSPQTAGVSLQVSSMKDRAQLGRGGDRTGGVQVQTDRDGHDQD